MSDKIRYKVLMSAYACEPGKGSEPGVGWNAAVNMAHYHDIWVLTRANNRGPIEKELTLTPIAGLNFIYYDLPEWARFWKKGKRGARIYYYIWQLGVIRIARKWHAEIGFDLGHHITFVKYWAPSFLVFSKIPYIWGPVGGGESVPLSFWASLGMRGFIYELARVVLRRISEYDPLVRLTAMRACVTIAATQETAARVKKIGAKKILIMSQVSLSDEELLQLTHIKSDINGKLIFLSIGRLFALKGFHLGVEGFALANIKDAEYWIIGDGPERHRLERLAVKRGVGDRVIFLGSQTRSSIIKTLADVFLLIHPSLHESGGYVSIEAMAAGVPVACLNIGGLALQVTRETGLLLTESSPKRTIEKLAEGMSMLASNPEVRSQKSEIGRKRVKDEFCWTKKAFQFNTLYCSISGKNSAFLR